MKGPYKKTAKQGSGEKPKLRLVHTINHDNGRTAKVYRDTEWNEYRIKYYQRNIAGKLQYLNKSDRLFSERLRSKQDAVDVAEFWCNRPESIYYAQA